LLDHLVDRAANAVEIVPLRAQRLEEWLKRQPASTAQWVRASGFAAQPGSLCLVPDEQGALARVLVGLEEGLDRWSMASLPATLPKGSYRIADSASRGDAQAAAFAWAIGGYRFRRYKKPADKPGEELARLVWPEDVDRAAIQRLVAALALARDLINTPAEDMGPAELANAAKAVARRFKAKCSVIAGDDLLAKNYPTVHTVGRASSRAPRLIDLGWGTAGPRLTLVGKGVCFDSGGLDLKPSSGMLMMKKDMGGAALMLALAQMIMAAGLKIRLRLLIPAVDNAVAGNAFRPLDVIRTRKGITVEVGNTDAEGRLILCDALAEAHRDKPDLIVDAATLTGAARVALGPDLPALFCNDDDVAEALLRHGRAEEDPFWRLPLHKGYRRMLDSKVADINNVSDGPFAGAITAALYLQEFIDPGMRWVHIDTFAWNPRERPGRPEGGEALGLRALYAFVEEWSRPRRRGAAVIAPKAAPRPRPVKQRVRRRR
jgi:leucyl aminopeptidase